MGLEKKCLSLDEKIGILLHKAENFCTLRNFLNIFGLHIPSPENFRKLEFRKKIGLNLGIILELIKFLEFRMP